MAGRRRSRDEGDDQNELERMRLELERMRLAGRFEIWYRLAWVPHIIASAVPLLVVFKMVQEVAGKDTNFNFSLTATVTISIALSAAVATLVVTVRNQKREIDRLRARIDELEGGE